MTEQQKETIWSFDLGTGSIGECIRCGEKISHLHSLILPKDFAALGEVRKRRHQIKTRIAHKKREEWWREKAKEAGIEVIETGHIDAKGIFTKPDERISKQFPSDNDKTIYNSCLLRIALLQGAKLEGWQIYKAIWSAIQHRGYDAALPWKKGLKRNLSSKENEVSAETANLQNQTEDIDPDEQENLTAVENYQKELEKIFSDKKFHLPCYYEAYKLGIWNPKFPDKLDGKLALNPEPARNKDNRTTHIPPRSLVAKELLLMLTKASEQYPKLKDKVRYILYGPAEKEYASCVDTKYKKYRGTEWDAQGLLSQKIPRFDNRAISKCVLIPRLNVCKAKDELNQEVTFLMKLKNIRYVNITTGETDIPLPLKNINDLFNTHKNTKHMTAKQVEKYLKTHLGGVPLAKNYEIEPPKTEGRSRFCRPALRILKEIILSGKSPCQYYKEWVATNRNHDPQKGLVENDLKFLKTMPDDWNKFYIPDHRLEESTLNKNNREQAISDILSSITNPVVRHRLILFVKRLDYLEKISGGKPDKIILEFAREGEESFQGAKNKNRLKWEKIQNENRQKKDEAYKSLQNSNITGKQSLLKMMLFKEQGGYDFYSMSPLEISKLDDYEIDHIVPRESGGSDAYINKILTTASNNRSKGNRTPYEWLSHNKSGWTNFIDAVRKSGLHDKKKTLLISENPADLINKYSDLASTSYISKLAQKIIHLYFGWPQLTEGSQRKVIIANGGLTAKLRRQYKLDRLLHSQLTDNEFIDLIKQGKIEEKNRSNPRHHALDALVISMIPELKPDPRTQKDVLPAWFHKDYCRKIIENVYPEPIRFKKPVLAETIYGLRKINRNGNISYVFVTHFGTGTRIGDFRKLENAKKYVSKIFDDRIRDDFENKLQTCATQQDWDNFLDNYTVGGSRPRRILKIESSQIEQQIGEKLENGTLGRYGEYIRGKMPGQWLKNKKEFFGFIVYQNKKGKWAREPIYAFESPYEKTEQFKKDQTVKNPVFFRSGMLVEIKNDCNIQNPEQKVTKGYWYLDTIMHTNTAKLTSIDGYKSVLSSLNNLMTNGKMKPVHKTHRLLLM